MYADSPVKVTHGPAVCTADLQQPKPIPIERNKKCLPPFFDDSYLSFYDPPTMQSGYMHFDDSSCRRSASPRAVMAMHSQSFANHTQYQALYQDAEGRPDRSSSASYSSTSSGVASNQYQPAAQSSYSPYAFDPTVIGSPSLPDSNVDTSILMSGEHDQDPGFFGLPAAEESYYGSLHSQW